MTTAVSIKNVRLMKKMHLRAEWHFVCECTGGGGSIYPFLGLVPPSAHPPLFKSSPSWLSETSRGFKWVWLCVLVCIDLEYIIKWDFQTRCSFLALAPGCFFRHWFWFENQISTIRSLVFVCDMDSDECASTASWHGDVWRSFWKKSYSGLQDHICVYP